MDEALWSCNNGGKRVHQHSCQERREKGTVPLRGIVVLERLSFDVVLIPGSLRYITAGSKVWMTCVRPQWVKMKRAG